ncbi:hypothetical protein BGZ60DRAFT_532841 [Tricladium varicosporioides]|nr:hypothetical protein BGZ60DRAFT_532841 [Hymenoscyphus varicosporioides]
MSDTSETSNRGTPETRGPDTLMQSNSPHYRERLFSGDSIQRGLGLGLREINFYDDIGKVRRWRKETAIEPRSVQANSPDVASVASGFETSLAAEEDEEVVDLHGFVRPPLPRRYRGFEYADSIELIDQLLEENYRGQAETFVRKSSRLRSTSRPVSAGSAYSWSPAPRFNTPTRSETKRTISASGIPRSVSYHRQVTSRTTPLRRSQTLNTLRNTPVRNSPLRTTSGRIIVEPYTVPSGLSPSQHTEGPHVTAYGHRVYSVPASESPFTRRSLSVRKRNIKRGPFYFTKEEREAIIELVLSNPHSCEKHSNCTDCREIEYSLIENKAMPTSMPPEERQKIINNNRSLRNIKNELENLAENGAIADDVYDQIMKLIPAESSLNASARGNAAPTPSPAPPTNAFSNLRVNNDPPPPAYTTPTPPSLPNRATPPKPEIARATALYRYTEPEDCNFEVGDQIAVYEYMNADWWLGRNIRTGKEGVFPVNYVQVAPTNPNPATPSPHGVYGNEKANAYPGAYQQQSQPPPPPGPSDPYNSSVPPMAVASGSSEPSKPGKGQEMGKKFGKKLGNAAIFGAGATIGGNIVNSIF